MIRLILTAAFILITPSANALDGLSLNVGTLSANGWQLQGVNIALTDLKQTPQKLALTINKLSLPEPLNDLTLANIRCTSFTWQNKELLCKQGRAQIHSKRWQSPDRQLFLHVTEKRSSFKLTDLHLAGGTVAIDGEERGEQWRLQIDAKAVDGKLIQQLLPQDRFKLKGGKMSLKLNASGSHARVQEFTLTTELKDLTGQTKDGRFAAEALNLEATVNAQNNNGLWQQWQSHSMFTGGALYIEPVYLEAGAQSIGLDAQGDWDELNKRVEITSASYRHSKVGELSGSASVHYRDGVKIETARLSLNSNNLEGLSPVYLKPFFAQTALAGILLVGNLKADFSINGQALTVVTATFDNFGVKDEAGRIAVQGGVGNVNWSDNVFFDKPSNVAWRQLQLRALPIGPSRLFLVAMRGASCGQWHGAAPAGSAAVQVARRAARAGCGRALVPHEFRQRRGLNPDMCGIAGLYSFGNAAPPAKGELAAMIGALHHRGPDGSSTFVDGPIGLAHARLRIIDLAGGAQPMRNEDGTVWVVFNGEIFNYVELRADARGARPPLPHRVRHRGHRPSLRGATATTSSSDLNGQFAIALWDDRRQRLVLARDRVGIRPLFYTRVDGRLAFASEVKALFALPGCRARLDPDGAGASVFSFWSRAGRRRTVVRGRHTACRRAT